MEQQIQSTTDSTFGEIAPGLGAMAVMGTVGDTKHIWDKNNPDEVAAARTMFDSLRAKRYLAFKVTKDGGRGDQINEFDPNEERLIMVPAMQGG